jgi:catechol 2,3-dioxygenase-like lactoylglutathione lyase family enzyme
MEDDETFKLNGINHLALVCSDMKRTVDFYTNVLGMKLVRSLDLPVGLGQHFFFDCGNGDCLAFFWFPDAPADSPGIARPKGRPDTASLTSAIGSMNHVAFTIPADKFEEYKKRLNDKGVPTSEIALHDRSEFQIATEMHDGVYVKSLYFQDPDGILLEFAAWVKPFDIQNDLEAEPKTAADLLSSL